MKKYTIPYSSLPGLEKSGVLAPMLQINFLNKTHEFPTVALVDSGADRGLISTVIADELGIKWSALDQYTGYTSGGKFTFRMFHDLTIEIFGTPFKIDIAIGEGISAFKCILGRKDIFQKAKITFEGYKNQFHIELRNLN